MYICLVVEKSCIPSLSNTIKGLMINVIDPKLFLIVPEREIFLFNNFRGDNVQVISEEIISTGYDIDYIKTALGDFGHRAGWYLQQFLKLDFGSYLKNLDPDASEYLIWDADTVLLKPLKFYTDDGRYMHTYGRSPLHKSYHVTYKKILKRSFVLNRSVISQYMMCRISDLDLFKYELCEVNGDLNWYDCVLNGLNLENGSEFSEYETIINFCLDNKKDCYQLIDSKWFLHGADIYLNIKNLNFSLLQKDFHEYDFVAFERHNLQFSIWKRLLRFVYFRLVLMLGWNP